MPAIKPFMSMITMQDVDHEDAMVPTGADQDLGEFIGALLGESVPMERPQGIGAGVIIDVGSVVDGILKPGYKVYYQQSYARKIVDVWVVDARAIIAYEELE